MGLARYIVPVIIALGFGTLAWMSSNTTPDATVLKPPWEQSPLFVTEAEIRAAQELARYLRTLPGEGNQGRARELEWTRGWHNRPIGNLDRPALRRLLSGNLFLHRIAVLDPHSRPTDDRIHLFHFGTDGILRTCHGGNRNWYRYRMVDDLIGAATYVTEYIGSRTEAPPSQDDRDSPEWWTSFMDPGEAWPRRPITFDALTGTLAVHSETPDGTWVQRIGHVQAAPFGRTGDACSEWQDSGGNLPSAKGDGRAIRNIVPLFRQDPTRPLRMGVYFSLYPPPKE